MPLHARAKRTYIVRRSNVPVTAENVHVLQMLDLLKNLSSYLDTDQNVKNTKEKFSKYIEKYGITKKDVDLYIRDFPLGIYKNYYELELEDVFAQSRQRASYR